MRLITLLVIFLFGGLFGCREVRNCEQPALADVAERLSDCLPVDSDTQMAKEQLAEWGFEHEVISADLLPQTATPELILTYRATPHPYDPQGKIAVLERDDDRWHTVFESPDPTSEIPSDGNATLKGNWWFELDQVGDIQGDRGADVLFQQRWSNITSRSDSYAKLLTAVDGQVRVLLVETDFRDHRPTYSMGDDAIYSQSRFIGGDIAITRTLVLEEDAFVVSAETINPAAATHAVTLPDGTQYVTFDGECGSLCYRQYGLYRIRDGEQLRYETPSMIHTVKLLRDGNVYVGGNELLRVSGDRLEIPFAAISRDSPWHIVDMAMTSDGDIWAAGLYKLLHFGRDKSEMYDLLSHRIFIAADDSVWAAGWDGRAEGGCCVFHVQNGEVTTYQRGEVSAEIAAQLDIEQ